MTKTRQAWVLTAVAAIAVFAAGYFLLVRHASNQVADLHNQTQAAQANADSLASKVSMLKQQQRTQSKEQAKLNQLLQRIPDNPALPTLIRTLSDAADSSGVELVSLAPQQPALVSGAPAGAAGQKAQQISLAVTVTGDYFNVEQFFANLEQLKRAMIVDQWTLAPGGSSASSSDTGASQDQLNATITGRVFMMSAGSTTTPARPAPQVTTPAKGASPASTASPAATGSQN